MSSHLRSASKIDPKKPQKSWRSAWRNLTRQVTCPGCGTKRQPAKTCFNQKCGADIKKVKGPLAVLRFHDLRHHAITELAESQASDSTIMAIAGHVSPKMLAHYSQVRLQAKRAALDALSAKRPESKRPEKAKSGGEAGSYDTNDTKTEVQPEQVPQVV